MDLKSVGSIQLKKILIHTSILARPIAMYYTRNPLPSAATCEASGSKLASLAEWTISGHFRSHPSTQEQNPIISGLLPVTSQSIRVISGHFRSIFGHTTVQIYYIRSLPVKFRSLLTSRFYLRSLPVYIKRREGGRRPTEQSVFKIFLSCWLFLEYF